MSETSNARVIAGAAMDLVFLKECHEREEALLLLIDEADKAREKVLSNNLSRTISTQIPWDDGAYLRALQEVRTHLHACSAAFTGVAQNTQAQIDRLESIMLGLTIGHYTEQQAVDQLIG